MKHNVTLLFSKKGEKYLLTSSDGSLRIAGEDVPHFLKKITVDKEKYAHIDPINCDFEDGVRFSESKQKKVMTNKVGDDVLLASIIQMSYGEKFPSTHKIVYTTLQKYRGILSKKFAKMI